MKILPSGDRVVIEPVEVPEFYGEDGIIARPETSKERPVEGIVVAAGPQTLYREGQRVLHGKFSGNEIVADGKTLLIMRDEEIFGVVERTAEELEKIARLNEEARAGAELLKTNMAGQVEGSRLVEIAR